MYTELLALYLYALGAFATNKNMVIEVEDGRMIRAPVIMCVAWPIVIPVLMALQYWNERNE